MDLHLEYEFNRVSDSDTCVVFLHGWGMEGKCFDVFRNRLKDIANTLTLDFFGFGKSSNPIKYFDTYEYAYHTYILLRKLGINKVVLVGHSFGGRIALLLSSIFDIEIKEQILTSSAGINTFNLFKEIKILRYKICKKLVACGVLNNKVLKKFGSDDYRNCSDVLRAVFVKVVGQDLKKHLKLNDTKTKLVWDKNDNITPYKICKILNKKLINSTIEIYKTGKHFAFLHNENKFSNLLLSAIN